MLVRGPRLIPKASRSSTLAYLQAPPEASQSSHESKMDPRIIGAIKHEFGSLGQLKSTFGAAAMGMSTSGWLWLALDLNRRLAVVPTYGSGTILVRSRRQALPRGLEPSLEKQSNVSSPTALNPSVTHPAASLFDSSSSTSPLSTSPSHSSSPSTPPTPFDRFGQTRAFANRSMTLSPNPSRLFIDGQVNRSNDLDINAAVGFVPDSKAPIHQFGAHLTPLFCVSIHEHAWMIDYGVWGKEEYMARFWDVLDWRKVSEIHNAVCALT